MTQSNNVRVDFTEELTLDEMPGDQVEIRHRRAENIGHIRGCSTVLQTAGGGACGLLKKMKQVRAAGAHEAEWWEETTE